MNNIEPSFQSQPLQSGQEISEKKIKQNIDRSQLSPSGLSSESQSPAQDIVSSYFPERFDLMKNNEILMNICTEIAWKEKDLTKDDTDIIQMVYNNVLLYYEEPNKFENKIKTYGTEEIQNNLIELKAKMKLNMSCQLNWENQKKELTRKLLSYLKESFKLKDCLKCELEKARADCWAPDLAGKTRLNMNLTLSRELYDKLFAKNGMYYMAYIAGNPKNGDKWQKELLSDMADILLDIIEKKSPGIFGTINKQECHDMLVNGKIWFSENYRKRPIIDIKSAWWPPSDKGIYALADAKKDRAIKIWQQGSV